MEVRDVSDMRALVLVAIGLIVLLAAACGGSDEESAFLEAEDGRMARFVVAGETVVVEKEVVIREVPVEMVVEREVIKEVEVPGETVMVEKVVTQLQLKEIAVGGSGGGGGSGSGRLGYYQWSA